MNTTPRLFACFLLSCAASSAYAQVTVRVSTNSSGVEGNDGSFGSALSADGRYVAFASVASDLVPGDTNGKVDVFVHDRKNGAIERVSVSSSGAEADSDCMGPYISADGRFVSFRGFASTLVTGDTNGASDVFVRDRATGVTSLASVSLGGGGGDDDSYYGSLSADGRFVCFISDAGDLVPGDTNHDYDVFVYDTNAGSMERVSLGSGEQQGDFFSIDSGISADGRYVVFTSWATNLLGIADTNWVGDVFRRDRLSGTTELVSVAMGGGLANLSSGLPAVSADGRFVTFTSDATNLVPGDANGFGDVFVRDMVAGVTERVSVSSAGVEGDESSAIYYSHAAISADGRFVVFESHATNLVAGDTNRGQDIFVRDRASATTERVSVRTNGDQGPTYSYSYRATISGDGKSVAFESNAPNFVPGDTNGVFDIFVHEARPDCPVVEAYCTAKTNSLGCTPVIGTSGFASLTANDGCFITAVDVLSHHGGIFVWGLAPATVPFGGGTLCVDQPLVYTRLMKSGGHGPADCSGVYSFHFSRGYMTSAGLTPGTTIYGQYLTRDPGFAPPDNIGLTDAIRFTICP